jgi:hypothetical protein
MAEKVSLRNVRDIVAEHGQALEALAPVFRRLNERLDSHDEGHTAHHRYATDTDETLFTHNMRLKSLEQQRDIRRASLWARLRWLAKGY